MQMVVNISKKDLEYAKDYIYGRCNVLAIHNTSRILGAIAEGKTLLKGHGRLIDADEYFKGSFGDAREFLDKATTIIEADRSEEE
jgi:hypothetical protein